MRTTYITKRQKISNYIKNMMKTYPKKPVEKEMLVNQIAFELAVSKSDIIEILDTATNLGYFEVEDKMIVSIPAKRMMENDQEKEIVSDEVEEIIK